MSTQTVDRTDVNAAFAAERAQQRSDMDAYNREAEAWNARPLAERQAEALAAEQARFADRVAKGELIDLGNGRYQSTEGWDRGEIWTLRASATGDRQMLAMPEHGLDIDPVTKRARLYSAVPAWHGLGQVIPGGISEVEDVIRIGQLDVPVYSIPAAPYEVPGVAGKVTPVGQFHVGNASTGEYWGTVGKIHKNIDVRTSFGFMQNVVGNNGVIWESAGLMGGGRKVFISCKVDGGILVDPSGLDEHVELFLVVQDTRDGSGSYRAMITPWRPLCQNTNRFATRDALSTIKLRHTSGLPAAIEKARAVLGLTVEYSQSFAAEETQLARTDTTLAEFQATMAELFAEGNDTPSGQVFAARKHDEESTRTRLANDRREEDLVQRFGTEAGRVGRTLYAAEQAYTGHLDWGKVRKGTDAAAKWNARIEASLDGEDEGLKTRAHAKLLQLAASR